MDIPFSMDRLTMQCVRLGGDQLQCFIQSDLNRKIMEELTLQLAPKL